MNARPVYTWNNTNLGVYEEVGYDALGASRGLSETRVTEADLLKQESITTTENCCGTLRASVRRDWVSLEGVMVLDQWMV